MNSAKRLAKILSNIKDVKEANALGTFESVFNVKGCTSVANKIMMCTLQIETLKRKGENDTTKYLDSLFSCKNLARDIRGERASIGQHITALSMAGDYMPEEKINTQSITELGELLVEMENKVNKITLSDEHERVVMNYMQEIKDAIIDIDIGGSTAFEKHIVVANGVYILYYDAFSSNNLYEIVNKIYEKSTKIISDFQTWSGVVGFMGGFITGRG